MTGGGGNTGNVLEGGVVGTWECCLWSRRSGLGVFNVRCGATAV